jgi:hypothetical protein
MIIFTLLLVPASVCGASAEPFKLRAEYSAWSGPVTWIQIGSHKQDVKVAIRVTEKLSWLWHPDHCPAFLDGGCFESHKSTTKKVVDFSTVVPSCDILADYVNIGGRTVNKQAFLHPKSSPLQVREGYIGLDVAGYIAAGPRSVMFHDRILLFEEPKTIHPIVDIVELDSTASEQIWFAEKIPSETDAFSFSA